MTFSSSPQAVPLTDVTTLHIMSTFRKQFSLYHFPVVVTLRKSIWIFSIKRSLTKKVLLWHRRQVSEPLQKLLENVLPQSIVHLPCSVFCLDAYTGSLLPTLVSFRAFSVGTLCMALANPCVPSGPGRALKPLLLPAQRSPFVAVLSLGSLVSAAPLQGWGFRPGLEQRLRGCVCRTVPQLSKSRSAHPCPVPPLLFCCWSCLPPLQARPVCTVWMLIKIEHFVIVIGCVEVLPTVMPFRRSLSCETDWDFCLLCTLLIGLRIKFKLF